MNDWICDVLNIKTSFLNSQIDISHVNLKLSNENYQLNIKYLSHSVSDKALFCVKFIFYFFPGVDQSSKATKLKQLKQSFIIDMYR